MIIKRHSLGTWPTRFLDSSLSRSLRAVNLKPNNLPYPKDNTSIASHLHRLTYESHSDTSLKTAQTVICCLTVPSLLKTVSYGRLTWESLCDFETEWNGFIIICIKMGVCNPRVVYPMHPKKNSSLLE